MRRSVFERVGLFSPAFPWGEDREFQLRAWGAGVQGLYLPAAVATCHVPPERLTKRYQRQWFGHAGRTHARMQLLERTDTRGRLVAPIRGRRVFRVPGYLLRQLVIEIRRWTRAFVSGDAEQAFIAENRIRYLVSYLAEHRHAVVAGGAVMPSATVIPTLPDAAGRGPH